MVVTAVADPVADAHRHLARLRELLAIDAPTRLDDIDVEALARSRPQWPPWPTPSLAMLVGPPAAVPRRLDLRWLHRFDATCRLLDAVVAALGGSAGGPSALSLLVERAALLGHRTWGTTSAGTSCRLLACGDGWIALNLPRRADVEAVPALVGLLGGVADHDDEATPEAPGVWEALAPVVAAASSAAVLDAARLLGLAAAAAPALGGAARTGRSPAERFGADALSVDGGPVFAAVGRAPRVVDLSSLWAGPLCGWYLARAGAEVTKVESSSRPDGARAGTPTFWRRLNADKTLVELDLASSAGVDDLRRLVAEADVVIEASRPRAMADFGIDPAEVVARGGIWCSISGYGRSRGSDAVDRSAFGGGVDRSAFGGGVDRSAFGGGVDRIAFGGGVDRIAFGDDAAVAGGLVADTGDEPWFIGDAAADPISGVTAALGSTALWLQGRGGLVDVGMADAVAALTDGGPVACTP